MDMQRELEHQRQVHEKELILLQANKDEECRDREERKKLMENMPRLTDTEQVDAYFIRFEELARNARIPQEEWANYLRPLLVGKALVAYTREVAEDDKQDYDRLKEALLMALGISIPLCEEEFFRVDKRPLQLWAEAARQVVSLLNRILQKSKTKEEIVTTMAISRLCSWVSPDCATYVRIQSPRHRERWRR